MFCFVFPCVNSKRLLEPLELTQGQIEHDLLLLRSLPTEHRVHGTEEPRDDVTRELHEPDQGAYASPRSLLAGAHSQTLGQPQVYRQQEA